LAVDNKSPPTSDVATDNASPKRRQPSAVHVMGTVSAPAASTISCVFDVNVPSGTTSESPP
jgi:hypothetical protein